MPCQEIRNKLNAWMDQELSDQDTQRVSRHLARCPDCRREADGLRQVAARLDALPAIHAPTSLARNTMAAFRARLEPPAMGDWWRGLTLAMRGAVCGAALAGLLLGAVLGTTFVLPGSSIAANPYQTLYASRGILP